MNEPGWEHRYAQRVIGYFLSRLMITAERFLARRGAREIVEARQMAMFLIRRRTQLSFESIGEIFQRDHGTVIHAVKAVQDRIDTDPYVHDRVQYLKERIKDEATIQEPTTFKLGRDVVSLGWPGFASRPGTYTA